MSNKTPKGDLDARRRAREIIRAVRVQLLDGRKVLLYLERDNGTFVENPLAKDDLNAAFDYIESGEADYIEELRREAE